MKVRIFRRRVNPFFSVVFVFLLSGFLLQEVPKPHWSKYKYPKKLPSNVKVHIVKKGDTLWDIAKLYLNNPFLWPQIWQLNKYIENANLIFPGDPIILPKLEEKTPPLEKKPTELPQAEVVPPKEKMVEVPKEAKEVPRAAEKVKLPPEVKEAERVKPPAKVAPTAIPLVNESDLYCSELIFPKKESPKLKIIGAQDRYVVGGIAGDFFYLNHGADKGLKEGDAFFVLRYTRKIKHPKTGDTLGWGVLQLGKAVVERVDPKSAIIRIVRSSHPINIGDWLLPAAEVPPVPPEEVPPCPEFTKRVETDKKGYVVSIDRGGEAVGKGDLVHIDLGAEDGVSPGDFFLIYNEDHPGETFVVVGQLVAVRVGERTTLCKIILSRREIKVGQRVKRQVKK